MDAAALQAGDIILTSENTLKSASIQLITLCAVSHAAVQLGLGRNDQFFCSQFVLEACKSAGLPLTDADPRLINPGDLLHMREGDVPSVRIHRPLQYVGHLKSPPPVEIASNLGR